MAQSIRKSLLQLIFSGAYLLRWNDKLRPVELTEIDKQAHKMLIACVLWHLYCRGTTDSAERIGLAKEIIEGGLFEYFYRLVITDIKPPVFYKIKENAADYAELTEYVLRQLESSFVAENVGCDSFWQRMCAWHRSDDHSGAARRILTAAHLFASQWEFALIKPLNSFDDEIEDIAESFVTGLDAFQDLPGLSELRTQGRALSRFANLCGQLRFQIRWTRIPRIPETTVLGHMFTVAVFSYFFSLSLGACQSRCNNNFFSGLFHDLPEVLTRDIISPVKSSVPNFAKIIKKYEADALEHRLFVPLRREGYQDLVSLISFYLGLPVGSEFTECYRTKDGQTVPLPNFETLQTSYNDDRYTPKDGIVIKISDRLAAFLETHNSIQTGVSSPKLVYAHYKLKSQLQNTENPAALNLEALLADFD